MGLCNQRAAIGRVGLTPEGGGKSLAGLLPHTSNAAVPRLICSAAQQLITEEPNPLRRRRPEIWLLQPQAGLAQDPPCTPLAWHSLATPTDAHHPLLGCSPTPDPVGAGGPFGMAFYAEGTWRDILSRGCGTGWGRGIGQGCSHCSASHPARPPAAPAPRLPPAPPGGPGPASAPPLRASGAGRRGDQAGR